MQKRNCGLF